MLSWFRSYRKLDFYWIEVLHGRLQAANMNFLHWTMCFGLCLDLALSCYLNWMISLCYENTRTEESPEREGNIGARHWAVSDSYPASPGFDHNNSSNSSDLYGSFPMGFLVCANSILIKLLEHIDASTRLQQCYWQIPPSKFQLSADVSCEFQMIGRSV